MKSNHLKITLFSSLFVFNLTAQNAIKTRPKKLILNSVSGSISNQNIKTHQGSFEDLMKLSTQESSASYENQIYYWQLQYSDLSNYQAEKIFPTYQSVCRAVFFGFEFKDKSKNKFREKSTFRIGLNYAKNNNLSGLFSKTGIDYNSQNDIEVITKETYSMLNSSKKLQVDFSGLYKINSDKRLSFYSGLGISLGKSYKNTTQIEYSFDRTYSGTNTDPSLNNSTRYYSTFKNKASFTGSTYIPLGIDYRLGKTDPFLKMFHVFLEARPTASLTTFSEIKPVTNLFISYGFGLKICRE